MEQEHEVLKCDCSFCQEIGQDEFWSGLNCVLDMLAKVFQIIVTHRHTNAYNATVMALSDLLDWAYKEMNGEERVVH